MYLIRFSNQGKTKLISMNSKKLLEEAHIGTKLNNSNEQHVERTQNMAI